MNHNGEKTHCINGHEFTPENIYLDPKGRQRSCRACRTLNNQKRRAINGKKMSACAAKWALENPERTRHIRRKSWLKPQGWTPEMFDSAKVEQDNRCAICKKEFSVKNKPCADHAHVEPPKPRGLLCSKCNFGIGNLQENPEIMLAAIAYVRKWSKHLR